MKIYIALLRGINVAGKKKILMAELRELLTLDGYKDVLTYIQSGNIIFRYSEVPNVEIESKISKLIEEHYGFKVPVLVLSKAQLLKIVEETPYNELYQEEKERIYYTLLKNAPSNSLIDDLMKQDYESEKFSITNDCVYFTCLKGYGKAKCNNTFFEKKLKVSATTRNRKTMDKLIALAEKLV